MQVARFVRWLESVSGLAAGVLGLFVLRDLLLMQRLIYYASPPDANAPFRLGQVIAALVLLVVAVAGALVHGWLGQRVGRMLLWGGAIPLIILAVLSGNLAGSSLLPAALLVLIAAAFSLLGEALTASEAQPRSRAADRQ